MRSPNPDLDTVVTIAIGSEGIGPDRYRELSTFLRATLSRYGTLVATTYGTGLTTDQPDTTPEDTTIFLVVNPPSLTPLRRHVASALRMYGATSAAFAVDSEHEPAFPTAYGFRP